MLDRIRDAYNVDRIAQSIAQVALEDRSHFEANCEKIIQTRSQSEAFLNRLIGSLSFFSQFPFHTTQRLSRGKRTRSRRVII